MAINVDRNVPRRAKRIAANPQTDDPNRGPRDKLACRAGLQGSDCPRGGGQRDERVKRGRNRSAHCDGVTYMMGEKGRRSNREDTNLGMP